MRVEHATIGRRVVHDAVLGVGGDERGAGTVAVRVAVAVRGAVRGLSTVVRVAMTVRVVIAAVFAGTHLRARASWSGVGRCVAVVTGVLKRGFPKSADISLNTFGTFSINLRPCSCEP